MWQVWIDTGGTFTDCVAVDPRGQWHRAKVLSTGIVRTRVVDVVDERRFRVGAGSPNLRGFEARVGAGPWLAVEGTTDGIVTLAGRATATAGETAEFRTGEEAPVVAARLVTGTAGTDALPPIEMRLGTTRGTNALLERRGAAPALFVTRGFGDLLRIGTQQRPELFALRIVKPEPLHGEVVEVRGRLAPNGSELESLDLDAVRREAERLVRSGVRNAAVALLHSWIDPTHESAVATVLRDCGFVSVSGSAELSPTLKLLPRAQTAVVDAYLAPVIAGYLESVAKALGSATGSGRPAIGRGVRVMTSAGGLVAADAFRAKDSLLSGPAGGVVGARRAAAACGIEKIITFDMGGTSTDVARIDTDFEYAFEHDVAGVRLVAAALAIESVAAGGGSVCCIEDQRLVVGPRSAGADPGPACYGRGGPLTITDVNLLLGRVDAARFAVPVDAAAANTALASLASASGRDPADMLAGFLEVANERMAEAIERVSVKRGYDPHDYTLVAFGGAGGQHACAVAGRLGVARVLVPADCGLLSALGVGHAVPERFEEEQVLLPLHEEAVWRRMDALAASATRKLTDEHGHGAGITVRRLVNLRVIGHDTPLTVEAREGGSLRAAFAARYRDVFGHDIDAATIEVESVRVMVSAAIQPIASNPMPAPHRRPAAHRTVRAWFDGARTEARVYDRGKLVPGDSISGPAIIADEHSTTVVELGWECFVHGSRALVMQAGGEPSQATTGARAPRHARIEIATGRLEAIATEMGEMLRRTAVSVNVKERLDYSCAILDAEAELVVNAPHVPVHLGALGVCVRALGHAIEIGPGDVVVTNHPRYGGSHLPDVTVVTPVHLDGELLGYVASRAHHAEIGGGTPGSMPPRATRLAEEGVVIAPMHLVRAGVARWENLRGVLGGGPWPSRAVATNLADIRAAVAANQRGVAALLEFARAAGFTAVRSAIADLKNRAEKRTRLALARFGTRELFAEEALDDGSPIRVRIAIEGGTARIDFTGSAGVHPGNLNATEAIVRSAVIYVLRLLVDEPLPLNEGIMRAVRVELPHGMLNPDFPLDATACPAVAGGNTEASQRVVDTLIKALGLCACGQGTMNNVLFGNDRFAYYETVCGGAGAGPGFVGADAVHTHMTNTRITDPEILEHRYPVRLERFAIRQGSGGQGRWRGGNGVVREIRFLEPVTVSVLTQHRGQGPFGACGGEAGAAGRQWIQRSEGSQTELGSVDGAACAPGDRLVIETPGGGGWGPPAE